jgi:hypothetical protein
VKERGELTKTLRVSLEEGEGGIKRGGGNLTQSPPPVHDPQPELSLHIDPITNIS